MHTVCTNQFPDVAPQGETHQPALGSILSFWLPVTIATLTILVINHHWSFAAEAGGESLGIDIRERENVSGLVLLLRKTGFLSLGIVGLFLYSQAKPPEHVHRPILLMSFSLCVLTAASVMWSVSPGVTLRRSALAISMCVGSFGIARHWNAGDVCRFALVASGLFALIGVIAECQAGTFLTGPSYRFSGTMHANSQAANCAVLTLSAAALFHQQRQWRWLLLVVVGGILELLTASRGATLALVGTLALTCWFSVRGAGRMALAAALVLALAAGLFYLAAFGYQFDRQWDELARMGREGDDAGQVTSLTGRIPIWLAVVDDIGGRPLLGYGYGSFWSQQRIDDYFRILDWEIKSAHNSYLEAMLEAGLLGLLLGCGVLLLTFRTHLAHYRRKRCAGALFIVGLLIFTAVHGAVEGFYIKPGLHLLLAILAAGLAAYHPFVAQEPQHE